MSGEFRDEQNTTIESTDDADLAKRYGLTQYNKATGVYTAPTPPDAGQRDGADVHEARHAAALAEGDAQHAADVERLEAALRLANEQHEADVAKLEAKLDEQDKAPQKPAGFKGKADTGK